MPKNNAQQNISKTVGAKEKMYLATLIADYETTLLAERALAKDTLTVYRRNLHRYARSLGAAPVVADITTPHFRKFVLSLKPSCQRMMIAAGRSFFGWLCKEGWLNINPALSVTMPKQEKSHRKPIPDTILEDMLLACDRLPKTPYRRALARAVVALFCFTGIRRAQLLSLKLDAVDFPERTLTFYNSKSKLTQKLYLVPECLQAVRGYLAVRPADCEGDFLLMRNKQEKLNENAMYRILAWCKTVSGHEGETISPHRIRHSYATRLAANGAPLPAIQAALGHSKLETTAIYIHSSEEQQKAVSHLASFKPTPPEPEVIVQKNGHSEVGKEKTAAWRKRLERR